jgi:hypothetical protein
MLLAKISTNGSAPETTDSRTLPAGRVTATGVNPSCSIVWMVGRFTVSTFAGRITRSDKKAEVL